MQDIRERGNLPWQLRIMVLIKLGPDVCRGSIRERVLGQQIQHVPLSLKEPKDKMHKPRIVFIAPQSSKPHLPV